MSTATTSGKMIAYFIFVGALLLRVQAYVHPIIVEGNRFVDSVTNVPFFIKGLDYQPDGSSGVLEKRDPLSDPKLCARDISLFQDLGINTIRVYSINSDLNHDECMTMLAVAGIYLVLDVNSPLQGHHLNRYEPWTTYTSDYLKNILTVVEEFSYYNNTLGFFAGNEILNDKTSAKNSPAYVKAVIKDVKQFIRQNAPRFIPVGYSAADDLDYRTSFANYLECVENTPDESVDFYGVNSYQWCGEQTFYTSGYVTLVEDYSEYSKPIFFSEYGCNEVKPRLFDEVQALYSKNMIDVFSGGLIYEFSQEDNDYGLVEIQEDHSIKLLQDYFTLKNQFDTLPEIDYDHLERTRRASKLKTKSLRYGSPRCKSEYDNLDITKVPPKSFAVKHIKSGFKSKRGNYVNISNIILSNTFEIHGLNGELYEKGKKIDLVTEVVSDKDSRENPPSFYRNEASDRLFSLYRLLIMTIICLYVLHVIM